MELIDLDQCVIKALKLFSKDMPKNLNIPFKRPIVLGSGNAAVTGKILFEDKDAVFADESSYQLKLKSAKVDGAVLISSSGGKHAPIIAKNLKKKKIKTILLTCSNNALAKRFADKTIVFPKNPEPYTYNTSTYMGMILSKTKEDPRSILNCIKKIRQRNVKDYEAFYMIVPEKFNNIREMFLTKFDELFGGRINGRIYTFEQTKHAKTVVPYDKELFISIGYENKIWGKNRWNLKLPQKKGYASLMAIGYYVIGMLQKQKPAYFKHNILSYTEKASKLFKQKIDLIV